MAETFSTVILIETADSVRNTAALDAETKAFREEVKRLSKGLKDQQAELGKLNTKLRENRRTNEDAAEKLKRFKREQALVNKVMRETGASAQVARKVVKAYGKDLNRAGREAVGAARGLDALARETRELTAAQRAGANSGGLASKTAASLARNMVGLAAAYFGAQAVIRTVNGLIVGSITAFADLQDAVVGLRKVTDGLGAEGLGKLVDRLEELSTSTVPIATERLIELAAVAGQLGIKTAEGLALAAETGAQLESATDVSGDAAIKQLARLLAIQGESIGAIDNLGSALVALGNDAKLTESELLPIASEIARATANFDIATPTILGLAAGFAEVGAKAQGAGSAFAELLNALLVARETGEGLEELARIAGVTSDELRTMATEDIAGAAIQFLKGLKTFGEAGRLELEKVGLASKVTSKALLPLAATAERVAFRMDQATTAASENTALSKEAAAAFSTLRADGQRLQSALRLLLSDGIAPLAGPMADILKDTTAMIVSFRGLGKGLKSLPGLAAIVGASFDAMFANTRRDISKAQKLFDGLGTNLSFFADELAILSLIPGGESFTDVATGVRGLSEVFEELSGEVEELVTVSDTVSDVEMDAAFEKWEKSAKKVTPEVKKVSSALESLQAQAIRQESVSRAMISLGLSAQEAATVVTTLTTIQTESGASALEAAENVAELLGNPDDASVQGVADLTRGLSAAKDELAEIAALRERIATAREEIVTAGLGIGEARPTGGISIPGSFQEPLEGIEEFGSLEEFFDANRDDIAAIMEHEEALGGAALAADVLQDAFGGLDGAIGDIARAMPGLLDSFKRMQAGAQGAGTDFAAGAINLATSLASDAFGFTGQRGPGEFGEDISGDFSKEAGEIGKVIGTVVGTIFFGVGGVLGGAIGELLGTVIGGVIKSGADELIFGATQAGDEIAGFVSRAEGPLGEVGEQMAGAFEEIFSGLEEVIGGAIFIQPSEIIGGPEIKAAGEAAVIKLRDGVFRLFMDGAVQEFETFDEALEAATLGLLAKAEFGEGVSDAVVAALTSGAGSLEELDERLKFALGVDKLLSDVGPVGTALEGFRAELRSNEKSLREIGLETSIATQLLDKRVEALREEIEANLMSVSGITDHAAVLRDLGQQSAEFAAGAEEERERRLALIAVLEEQRAGFVQMNDTAQAGISAFGNFEDFMLDGIEGLRGFGRAGRGFQGQMEDSARSIEDTDRQIEALKDSLETVPLALDAQLMAQAMAQVTQNAVDGFQGLLAQFDGFAANTAAAEASRNALARGRIAIELQGLRDMLATAVALSALQRAALEEAIAAGEALLGGGAKLRRPGAGGGGGRRAEADRALEETARAAEAFRERVQELRDELSDATPSQLAYRDAVADLTEQWEAGKLGAEELSEASALLAAVDLRALAEEWTLTGRELRETDLAASVRGLRESFRDARGDAQARREADPEGFKAAMSVIREGLRLQMRELGKAAIGGLAGPLQRLKKEGKETVKEIAFIVNHLSALGLTANQVAKTIRGDVKPQLLDLAISEAQRVGDATLVAELQEKQARIAMATKLAELAILEGMLIAANAMTGPLQEIIDQTREMIGLADDSRATIEDASAAIRRSGTSGAAGTTTSTTTAGNLDALLDAISNFVRGMEQIDLGVFTRQAQDWINQVSDLNRDVDRALDELTTTDIGLLRFAGTTLFGDAEKFLTGSVEEVQAIADFIATIPGTVASGLADELEVLIAAAGLEGALTAGFSNLVKQFSAPLDDALTPLQQLDEQYADLLAAADLLLASDQELAAAEQAFHDLRMKLLDEQLGGLRELLDEAETAILRSQAPREQLIAAREEFEAASEAVDINNPASIARLEDAVRNYKSVALAYDELIGVNVTASVNDAIAAALHLFLDPFTADPGEVPIPVPGPGPQVPEPGGPVEGPIPSPSGLTLGSAASEAFFVPSPSTLTAPPATVVVTVSGMEQLTEDFSDFKADIELRFARDADLRVRMVDALERLPN